MSNQLVVVACRLPVRLVGRGADRTWVTSPGGLVAALTPVLRSRRSAAWVGWTGTSGGPTEPFHHDGMDLRPVDLSSAEIEQFYEGFSNGSLWPLYHDVIAQPEYHRTWWESYRLVNQRFAAEAAKVAERDATVWVHDYQLQLVPAMLRELRPDLRIGFFLHIPFPARELFLRLPWRSQIAEGLLGADIVGFQTIVAAHNFLHVLPRVTDASIKRRSVSYQGRTVGVVRAPVGIDAARIDDLARDPWTAESAARVRHDLGDPQTLLLGVDRLDYTKGIDRRLRAFAELLGERRLDPRETVMVQIAEPSRSNVVGYSEIRHEVEQIVGEINGAFGTMGRPVVHYFHQSFPLEELVALYSTADVMVVTPYRDGMNLVAKEYVASRVNRNGALVLSEFAGAAHQLSSAVLVNPYDTDGLKVAIETAVDMPPDEQRVRMTAMRSNVRRASAERWSRSFLEILEP